MTRTADLVKTTVEIGYAIAGGEPYEVMLTSRLASLFGVDAGAALNDCPTNPGMLWRATVAAAEPLTDARVKHCMRVAPRHPAVRAFQRVGVTEPIRLSDIVRLRSFWGTEPYQAMHENENGRYPMGMAVQLHSQRLLFIGLQRTQHDFTDSEMNELATVQRMVAAALRFRHEVDHLIAQLPPVAEQEPPTASESGSRTGEPGSTLTPRESEVLALAARGWTNHHIGSQLGITERTVRKHLSSTYSKIRTNGRSAAVVWWERHVAR